MKKYLFLLSTMALFFASCEGPMGPPGAPGVGYAPYVENIVIKSESWNFVESTDYVSIYEYLIDFKVGDRGYNDGTIDVYIYQMEGQNEVQAKLPQWVQYSQQGNTWIEGFDFNFDRGTIAFFAECKKGLRPPTCEFRVVRTP